MTQRMSFFDFILFVFNKEVYLDKLRKEAMSKVSSLLFGMRLEEHIHSIGETVVISLEAYATSREYVVVSRAIPNDKTQYTKTVVLGKTSFDKPLEASRLYKKLYISQKEMIEEKKTHTI